MESEAKLLSELFFEILSRTSLETLEQCKSVSKEWKQIIYEPTFIPLHSQRTNSLYGYFFQTLKSSKSHSAFVSTAPGAINSTWPRNEGVEILASCDQGILICERGICRNKRFYACKPATAQWQPLPNPKLRYQTKSVAVVVARSHPLRYVIVRLYSLGSQLHCEIFDSERWRWEKIDNSPLYGEIVINCSPSVTTAGRFVHWLTLNDSVLTLDVEKRRFRCSALPGCLPMCRWTLPALVEYEGELGFMCQVEEKEDRSEMEVWSNGKKKAVVNMRDIGLGLDLQHPVAVEFCSSNVVFIRSMEGGGFYNMQNRSFSKVEVPYDLRIPMQVFRFRSDSQIVHLRGGCHASNTRRR
ncbi:uncharacterized protein LOC125205249 [Salvia hispanica]|uniref:uncharacterized protein LOC125205211 n=1 Tax=Salvia hispanica TaxID=49212 RepID=UPI0020091A71|nr:uncharacterized protein LOC125205211 [Salvia hispanica]XP_047960036.1 uncharacterized protein LOC125205249 [Salvia hispanica]